MIHRAQDNIYLLVQFTTMNTKEHLDEEVHSVRAKKLPGTDPFVPMELDPLMHVFASSGAPQKKLFRVFLWKFHYVGLIVTTSD